MSYKTVQLVRKFKEDIHITHGVHASLHFRKEGKVRDIYSLTLSRMRKSDETFI
jgi:hypothetical protein